MPFFFFLLLVLGEFFCPASVFPSCYGDCFNGYGVFFQKGQPSYAGQWTHGYYHGHGMLYFADHSIFIGNWVNGVCNEDGEIIRPNGSSERGLIRNGTFVAIDESHPETKVGSSGASLSDFKKTTAPGLYPEASTRRLRHVDLANKNLLELQLMRNEIYARHFYTFKDKELLSYFTNQPWYSPVYSDVSNLLSKNEHVNVRLISDYEIKFLNKKIVTSEFRSTSEKK